MEDKIKYLLIVMFLPISLNAQFAKVKKLNVNFDFGLLVEMTDLISTQNSYLHSKETHVDLIPFSIYLSGSVSLNQNFILEFRPGIIFGGDAFTGLEYGVYLRYLFCNSKYFLVGGINIHNNAEIAHGVTSYVESTDESTILLGISGGYKMHDNFAFIIGIYKPLANYLYFHKLISDGQSYLLQNRNLNYLIKAGFDITF